MGVHTNGWQVAQLAKQRFARNRRSTYKVCRQIGVGVEFTPQGDIEKSLREPWHPYGAKSPFWINPPAFSVTHSLLPAHSGLVWAG